MDKIKIATVFSGIGAFEQALNKLKIDYEIIFACDNGEREINKSREEIVAESNKNNMDINEYVSLLYSKTKRKNMMKKSYFANYDITEDRWYDDIRFIDGSKYENKVDIFVGGSPCQSFSLIGKRAGLEDARGTLFYDYARLVQEIKPKVFIYENVPGMLSHDKGNTWKVINEVFQSLGYKTYMSILNSLDYGIPQDRKRLFIVGFKDNNMNFSFPKPIPLKTTLFDYLEDNVDAKYYLGEKGFEFVTNSKNKNRAKINQNIIRTQKANQQFNWNGDFIFEPLDLKKHTKEILECAYVGEYEDKLGVIRQLTHRECMRLMGFPDSYKIVVTNIWAYRQAGNSIVVNVLEELLKEIFKQFDSKKIRLATVFSGIGSIEFALKRLNIPYEIIFACDNGERDIDYNEIEEKEKVFSLPNIKAKKEYVDNLYASKTKKTNFVKTTYLANYNKIDENYYFEDVKLLDGRDFYNRVDLLVGGSPCQSFSSVGSQHGLEDTRGTLFYEYARLIKEIKPKVFIYENVRNLLKHDNGNTWNIVKKTFDELGYYYKFAVLNSADYGIPQTRRRLFVVGFNKRVEFNMPPKTQELKYKMKDFTINECAEGHFNFDSNGEIVIEKIHGLVEDNYTLSPKIYNYVMKSGTKGFYQKPIINLDIARTLLKTMGNRHRAGVDNYLSFDGTNNLGSVRMLTEREALRLMGFTDDFKIVVSKAQTYKQAGNSIVVDVMMAILNEILKTGVMEG